MPLDPRDPYGLRTQPGGAGYTGAPTTTAPTANGINPRDPFGLSTQPGGANYNGQTVNPTSGGLSPWGTTMSSSIESPVLSSAAAPTISSPVAPTSSPTSSPWGTSLSSGDPFSQPTSHGYNYIKPREQVADSMMRFRYRPQPKGLFDI